MPYDKLKRALRAEVDEEAWSVLYQTESRPFSRPKRGQIAVKVIKIQMILHNLTKAVYSVVIVVIVEAFLQSQICLKFDLSLFYQTRSRNAPEYYFS